MLESLEYKHFEEDLKCLSFIDTSKSFGLSHQACFISGGFNFPFNSILLNKIKYNINKDEEISA